LVKFFAIMNVDKMINTTIQAYFSNVFGLRHLQEYIEIINLCVMNLKFRKKKNVKKCFSSIVYFILLDLYNRIWLEFEL